MDSLTYGPHAVMFPKVFSYLVAGYRLCPFFCEITSKGVIPLQFPSSTEKYSFPYIFANLILSNF